MLASLVGQLVKNQPAMQEFDPWVGKITWRRKKLPTSVFWFREQGCKKLDMTECLSLHFCYAHHWAHHEGAVEKTDYLNRENPSGSKRNDLQKGNKLGNI